MYAELNRVFMYKAVKSEEEKNMENKNMTLAVTDSVVPHFTVKVVLLG